MERTVKKALWLGAGLVFIVLATEPVGIRSQFVIGVAAISAMTLIRALRLSGAWRHIFLALGTAVLFMRVDGAGVVQTSDYMQNRPLMFTMDWSRQEIVVDVPRDAIGMTYGFLLSGSGQAWLDDVEIEEVGNNVPSTGQPGGLYPLANKTLSPGELDHRRREQELAYRRVSDAPVNLTLHATGGTVVVAARNNLQ